MTPEIQLNSSMTADVSNPMAIAALPRLDGSTLVLLPNVMEQRAVL